MSDDLYGFRPGELVTFTTQYGLYGRVLRRTSAEGRLLVACTVQGRRQEFACLPTTLKSLTRQEAPHV